MTVTGPDGGQVAPDWGCYDAGAAVFLPFHPAFRPIPFDTDGGDGGDASDAASDDAATPVDAGVDSAAPEDASQPDSSVPDSSVPVDAGDAGTPYVLHLTDFVTGTPPVGASAKIIWGNSSLQPVAFSGTVDDAGLLFFPAPPSGFGTMTYELNDAGQAPLVWLGAVIAAPPAQSNYNSLATSSLRELVTSVLGSQSPDPNLATLVTGAADCEGRDVMGAQFVIVDTQNNDQPIPLGTSLGSPRAFYLQNNLPNTACTYTTNSGRPVWSVVNAPVDTSGRYKLRFFGRIDPTQTSPVLVAESPVEAYPGTTSVLRSGKLNAFPPN